MNQKIAKSEKWFDFLTLNHTKGGGGKEREEGIVPPGKTLFSHLRARNFPDREKWNVLCYDCQRVDKNNRIESPWLQEKIMEKYENLG